MRHSLFIPSACGFVLGVFVFSFYSISFSVLLFVLFTALSVFIHALAFQTQFQNKEIKQYSLIFLATLACIFFSLGCIRYYFFNTDREDIFFHNYIDQEITVGGVVVSDTEERETSTRFIVEVKKIIQKSNQDKDEDYVSLENEIKPTRILVNDRLYSEIKYGDRIELKGELSLPENFETESGRTFDYIKYLAKDKIFYTVRYPEIITIGQHQGNRIKEWLFILRKKYIENIDAAIPYPESRLGAGITIAGKGALPQNVEDDFQGSGTMQVVVLSGYNLTIVAETITLLLSRLPIFVSTSMGIIGLILFTLMAGGSATVVRGGIMASLVVLSKFLERRYSVVRALALTAIIMLIVNPMMLVYDPSFQLSFLATVGLIFVSPIVEKHMQWITKRWKLREILSTTVASQIFVTPFILYLTQELSLVAVPANLFLTLVIPLAMLLCFIAGMLGFISTLFSTFVGVGGFVLLKYMLTVVSIFAHIPYASITLPYFPLSVMCVVYICYAVYIRRFYQETPIK